jgi:glutamate N-acetyltransferase/amino-acid N-acetyltransferase
MSNFTIIKNGGVTTPSGFSASGITAGLKKSGNKDMALIFSEVPANAAGAFTTSLFPAAPVVLAKDTLKTNNKFQAVIINSGIANACTGKQGLKDAEKMAELTASELKIEPEEVFVSSTGRIGTHLPMDIITNGIELAIKHLSTDGGSDAAAAIMTTDTTPKEVCVSLNLNGNTVHIGGIAKGAGMIAPSMKVPHATMLSYITTDADIESTLLSSLLQNAVSGSFNRVTVDGDMSTNDTVIIMANGKAGNTTLTAESPEISKFTEALDYVMQYLAKAIVYDAEGATKFVTVQVKNAKFAKDAELCADAISNSLLCKTAWFGGDPNWGRVLAAAGYSGASFNPATVDLFYNDKPVVIHGEDAGTEEAELEEVLKNKEFTLTLDLNDGDCSYRMWTNDITYEYVKINAEYHT